MTPDGKSFLTSVSDENDDLTQNLDEWVPNTNGLENLVVDLEKGSEALADVVEGWIPEEEKLGKLLYTAEESHEVLVDVVENFLSYAGILADESSSKSSTDSTNFKTGRILYHELRAGTYLIKGQHVATEYGRSSEDEAETRARVRNFRERRRSRSGGFFSMLGY